MAGLLRWVCGFGGSLVFFFFLLRHLDCVLIEKSVFLVVVVVCFWMEGGFVL